MHVGESLGSGNLAMRSFSIGAGAAESFWRVHAKGAGPASAQGLGLSDRYNRFLCHIALGGITTSISLRSKSSSHLCKKDVALAAIEDRDHRRNTLSLRNVLYCASQVLAKVFDSAT